MQVKHLLIFRQLDLLSNPQILVGTESDIFDSYDEWAYSTNKKLIIAYCHDEVIMSYGLRKQITNLEKDLANNPNIHLIYISMYKYPLPLNLQNFHFIYFPEWHGIYWDYYKDVEPANTNKIEMKFLSLNKRADVYRQLLYYKFKYENWIDHNIFSYLCEDSLFENLNSCTSFENVDKIIKYRFPNINLPTPNEKSVSIKNDYLLDQYKALLGTGDPTWSINKEWFDKTYCSIVIETDADDNYPNLSEKTFRAIVMQHPLLLFGSEHIKTTLKSLNLDIEIEWDEGPNRFNNFLSEIDNIGNTDIDILRKNRIKMMDKLIHLRTEYSKLHGKIEIKEKEILSYVLNQINSLKLL